MVVVALANQKGGVAKTTSAVNLAAYLAAEHGKKILLVDFDHQGNATLAMGYMPHELELTIYDVVVGLDSGGPSAEEVVLPAPREDPIEGLELVPANLNLAGAEADLWRAMGRESVLKRALDPVVGRYDLVIIDTPPSLGILTINALYASDALLVPLSTDMFALSGIPILLGVLERMRRGLGRGPKVLGYFLTMYEARTAIARQVEEKVREMFGQLVFETVIPKNVAAREAAGHGKPLLQYAPESKAAKAYRRLAEEFLDRVGS